MDKRDLVLQYIQESIQTYWDNYFEYVRYTAASDVTNMSFKHKPSLTYLDLCCGTLSTETRLPTRWESWRYYLDIRKEIIYRLDLEDKNQWTQCSEFCYQLRNFPLNENWTLDYDGFPGYIRLHDVGKPKECDFVSISFLDGDIIDFVSESRVVKDAILKFLPNIQLLQGWISITDILRIYANFLTIVYETRSKDVALIDTLLNYSKHLGFCREMQPNIVNWLILISQNTNLTNSEWLYRGACGLTIELIPHNPSSFKAFLHYGLYSFMGKAITADRTSNDAFEKKFIRRYDNFIRWCLPNELLHQKRNSLSTKLTNIDILCLIALRAYKRVEIAAFQEVLAMLWKCISNAYLVFEDFEQLFEELSEAEREELRIIYIWHRKAIGTDISYDRSPRTLQQYCRCAVRKRLVKNSNISNCIEKLPLPKPWKSFLKLE